MGCDGGARIHRSSVVFRRGLVSGYLVGKGIDLRGRPGSQSGFPFLAADLGNFAGGAVSGYFVRIGWSLGWSRKVVVIAGGCGTMLLIPTVFTQNLWFITALLQSQHSRTQPSVRSQMCFHLNLYHSNAVATVSGLSGSCAGIGTIIVMKAIGYISDARVARGGHAFDPVMIASESFLFIGMLLVLLLVSKYKVYGRESRAAYLNT